MCCYDSFKVVKLTYIYIECNLSMNLGHPKMYNLKIKHIDMLLEIGQVGTKDIFVHNNKFNHTTETKSKVSVNIILC